MSNYPWCSLTPRDNISDIETRWLECQFWWRLSFIINQNAAVPITKVLTSVSFLYHPLPPPRVVSVSHEPHSSLTHTQSSVSRCPLSQFPPLPGVCQAPTVPNSPHVTPESSVSRPAANIDIDPPSPTCCRWRTQSRGHHCCQDFHSWQECQLKRYIQASHWSWYRMSVNPQGWQCSPN